MHNRRKRGNQGKKIAKATLHINMPDGEASLTLDGATFDLAGLKFTGLNLMDKKNDDNTEDEALARCAMILEKTVLVQNVLDIKGFFVKYLQCR